MAALESPIAVLSRRAVVRRWLLRFLAVVGPGIVVAFADTEAGSVTTAATSGAQYGYSLILLQLLLIVPLFVVQEMTVRVGIASGRGHAELIFERFGRFWGYFSMLDLTIGNVLTLITEFIAIRAGAAFFGIPAPLAVFAGVALVIASISFRRYFAWERGAMVPQRMVPVERAPLNIGMSIAMTTTMAPSTAPTW